MRGAVEVAVEFRPRHGRRMIGLLDRVAEAATMHELPAGRWRAVFELAADTRGFGTLAALLEEVGDRRTTAVWVDGQPESAAIVHDMACCARPFAMVEGRCGFAYSFLVPDRCRTCPLYDADRAEAMIAASYADVERAG